MSSLASRLLVGAVGLPLVLGLLWLGGWWLFALVAVAACIGVHEFVTIARPLRPLAPAAYLGTLLGLVGAETGGIVWMLGGVLTVFLAAFVLNVFAQTRVNATAAIGATVLCAVWLGFGLGHVVLLRDMGTEARTLAFTVLLVVFAADTFAYFVGRLLVATSSRPASRRARRGRDLAAGSVAGVFVAFVALYSDRDTFLVIWQAIVLGVVVIVAALAGDLFESMLKRDLQVKDTGRLLGGHGGMLDRLDAILFAAPAAYYLVLAFHYS